METLRKQIQSFICEGIVHRSFPHWVIKDSHCTIVAGLLGDLYLLEQMC